MLRWFHSLKAKALRSRAHAGVTRAQRGEINVDAANTPNYEMADVGPRDGNKAQFDTLFQRSRALHTQYKQFGKIDDLNQAIVLSQEALFHCPTNIRSVALNVHGSHLSSRYDRLGGVDDLSEAIGLLREALSLCLPGHPLRLRSLLLLTVLLSSRYRKLGVIDDLNETIHLYPEVISLYPPSDPARSLTLNSLAVHLSFRYEKLGVIEDLNEAIVFTREALSLCPPGHPDRSKSLNNLSAYLCSRYQRLGGVDDLNETIVLGREALSLRPPTDPDHSMSLSNLAAYLCSRYKQLGVIDDLNEAISLTRETLSLRPPGHPSRSVPLTNLASYLSSRYEQLGIIGDLNEAIVLDREAHPLCSLGHPDRSTSLSNCAAHLFSRYQRLGGIDDLNEAIVLNQEALSLRPPGHPDRSTSLSNLAGGLSSLYEQLGIIDNLNEAIVLAREALSLHPHAHPDRPRSLNNLATHLSFRYGQLEVIDDLNEAITFAQGALSLCPPGHPDRSMALINLASRLSSRYEQLGLIDDLNEAIVLGREALSLRPPGHPDRPASLSNLANDLSSLYKQLGAIDGLNEAIALAQEALLLCPSGHPGRSASLNSLALHLSSRYEQLGGIDDLNDAIVFDREALSLCPPGHPDHSISLRNLAVHLSLRYTYLGSNDDAVGDKHELFAVYAGLEQVSHTVSSGDLLGARAWVYRAEEFHHPSVLSAYETALRLLVEHSASLPPLPQHLALLKSLSSSLAVDAFSAFLRNQSPANAVELLEQGRGIFWTQLTRLRSPLDDVIAFGPQGKALADEFTRLTSLIRMALHSSGENQHDRVWTLNLELKKVVSNIRELPGLSRFLLPSLFSDLRHAARDGPVIIVNASKHGCDALVVFVDKDPVHIPLPVTKEVVRGLSLNLDALRGLAAQRRMDMTTDFESFLQELWDRVVSHIVEVLRRTCPHQSRIWWCPTAEFSSLPLHAAATYGDGQQSVSDLFISSYTTTLTALIYSRRPNIQNSEREKKRFIAIGQAEAPRLPKLHSIHTELKNVKRHVKPIVTFTRIEGRDAHISGVADKLGENEWVHFACHGLSNQERPFESAFALRDGLFTIRRIIQCNLQNPEFAYLSACQTTVGDQENPDEVIHLASAMQFAGFRSVVGTMWFVVDSPATKVASTFYQLMVDELGCLDYTRAAWALWKTLRMVDIPLDQRILYIHLGA